MPAGCIWSALAWLAGAAPTFVWVIYAEWPRCGGVFACLGDYGWLAVEAAFLAAIWPVYWVVALV